MDEERLMQNDTLGAEELEVSELVRVFRKEKKVSQTELYEGLCTSKVYVRLERGEGILDEFLSERLLSRLHVQYRLIDIMLDDQNFWQKECRQKVRCLIEREKWKEAESLLAEYEERAPKHKIHKQFLLAKRAELLYLQGDTLTGTLFREALELTMTVFELERRLVGSGVVAEDEIWLYLRYRSLECPCTKDEYILLLKQMERLFLDVQIYPEVYFETGYQYASLLLKSEEFDNCRRICNRLLELLQRSVKNFHMAEFHWMAAICKRKQGKDKDEEKEIRQQCKMAYYAAKSFGKNAVAEKIAVYGKEEFAWHIIE